MPFNGNAFAAERRDMVERQIRRRGVKDRLVLKAMERTPRHLFVPADHRQLSYEDCALPIGQDQSISQPYMVAAMTEALELTADSAVLEIGTGSGYQTAVLAELAAKVYTIERLAGLAETAEHLLKSLGYSNIEFRIGDGAQGWPDAAPFDGILVTAAAAHVPSPLIEQLDHCRSLVIPVGGHPDQDLYQIKRMGQTYERRFITRCRFVPLVEGTIEKA